MTSHAAPSSLPGWRRPGQPVRTPRPGHGARPHRGCLLCRLPGDPRASAHAGGAEWRFQGGLLGAQGWAPAAAAVPAGPGRAPGSAARSSSDGHGEVCRGVCPPLVCVWNEGGVRHGCPRNALPPSPRLRAPPGACSGRGCRERVQGQVSHVRAHTHVDTHVCLHACTCECACMYARMHMYMGACLWAHVSVHIQVHMHGHVCAHVHACCTSAHVACACACECVTACDVCGHSQRPPWVWQPMPRRPGAPPVPAFPTAVGRDPAFRWQREHSWRSGSLLCASQGNSAKGGGSAEGTGGLSHSQLGFESGPGSRRLSPGWTRRFL